MQLWTNRKIPLFNSGSRFTRRRGLMNFPSEKTKMTRKQLKEFEGDDRRQAEFAVVGSAGSAASTGVVGSAGSACAHADAGARDGRGAPE